MKLTRGERARIYFDIKMYTIRNRWRQLLRFMWYFLLFVYLITLLFRRISDVSNNVHSMPICRWVKFHRHTRHANQPSRTRTQTAAAVRCVSFGFKTEKKSNWPVCVYVFRRQFVYIILFRDDRWNVNFWSDVQFKENLLTLHILLCSSD